LASIFSTASSVLTSVSVPGCGLPSCVHRSHGRRFIIDSAYSAPTSASLGNFSHAFFMAAEYALLSFSRSFGGGLA
jgi:hypothetical protein